MECVSRHIQLVYSTSLTKIYRNEINVIIVAACIPTLQPLLSGFESTRCAKTYRQSGSDEERIELGNLAGAYAVKRDRTVGFSRDAQLRNNLSIQRTTDVDVCMGVA